MAGAIGSDNGFVYANSADIGVPAVGITIEYADGRVQHLDNSPESYIREAGSDRKIVLISNQCRIEGNTQREQERK